MGSCVVNDYGSTDRITRISCDPHPPAIDSAGLGSKALHTPRVRGLFFLFSKRLSSSNAFGSRPREGVNHATTHLTLTPSLQFFYHCVAHYHYPVKGVCSGKPGALAPVTPTAAATGSDHAVPMSGVAPRAGHFGPKMRLIRKSLESMTTI